MAIACFDIGGTSVKFGLIGSDKQIAKRDQIATPETREALLTWIASKLDNETLDAISMSVPGAINQITGEIKGLSAIPYIHGVSWYELLDSYQVPVYLENDANCVGLSELAIDETTQNCACVVCGTGIGGALIINRQLVRGKKSYGGEFGYMMIDGMAEPLKNWSQLASTGSLVRRVASHPDKQHEEWDGRKIFKQANAGDGICQQAIQQMVQKFAVGLMNLYYFFDPEVIYIGGSISQNEQFIALVQTELQRLVTAYQDDFPEVPVVRACTYTQDANLMGAYMNALQG